MANFAVAFLVCFLAFGTLNVSDCERIVLNEDDLMGTCTGTCEGIPTLYDRGGCTKISGCRRSSTGWNRGFVRCDYCSCSCERSTGDRDVVVEEKHLSVTEPDLYGTCTGTCSKSGLVRTDFRGCQRVENCNKARNGWTRGFVRCDYCTCWCINRKEAKSYKLENVRYDMTNVNVHIGQPTSLASTILENGSGDSQTVTRVLTFTATRTTSLTSSHSWATGLTVTVEASAGVEEIATVKSSVATTLTTGYTETAGKSNTTSKMDQIRAEIRVPPRSSITAIMIGHRMRVDIPYTAVLVTTYEDGSTARKSITGVYNNVDTGRYRVHYGAASPFTTM